MYDYHRLIKLIEKDLNTTQIARSLGISRPTVSNLLDRFETNNLSFAAAKEMTVSKIHTILFENAQSVTITYVMPDYAVVHVELADKEVTMKQLWTEYRNNNMGPGAKCYAYVRFCQLYRKWAGEKKLVMRIHHKPGDAMEVDWVGVKPTYRDPETNELREAHVFVAALPYSLDFYYEVTADEKEDSFIMAHVHAYEYFGGVTRLLKPDNLKTGVTSHSRLKINLNKEYEELADHYDTAIVPTRVQKPSDKSHAESSVSIIERRIIAPVRHETPVGIDRLRELMEREAEVFRQESVPVLGCTRREYYEKEEKQFMKPLPAEVFEPVQWTSAKVGRDYLVKAGENYYSVPYKYVGKTVSVRISPLTVMVSYQFEKIAEHVFVRDKARFPFVQEEHMPPNHREYLHYTKKDFLEYAESVGPETLKAFQYLFDNAKEPEQVFPFCASLKALGKDHGAERLEKACAAAQANGKTLDLQEVDKFVKQPSLIRDRMDQDRTQANVHHASAGFTRGSEQFDVSDK